MEVDERPLDVRYERNAASEQERSITRSSVEKTPEASVEFLTSVQRGEGFEKMRYGIFSFQELELGCVFEGAEELLGGESRSRMILAEQKRLLQTGPANDLDPVGVERVERRRKDLRPFQNGAHPREVEFELSRERGSSFQQDGILELGHKRYRR